MSFAACCFPQQRFICLKVIFLKKKCVWIPSILQTVSTFHRVWTNVWISKCVPSSDSLILNSNKDNHAENRAKAFSADFRELWHLKWQYNLQTLPLTVIPSSSAWIHEWGLTGTPEWTYLIRGRQWRQLVSHHPLWQSSFCWDHI